ncbi:MAG: protein translocase subunit SecD [Planctomycetia bacterium]|nr:protein translocase subunit SecD [Planctomycetia bacterium]
MTEQKPVLGRWVLIALVVATLLWAFQRERTPERPWGMALGQDLRGGTTLRFHLDIEGARKAKTLGAGESDATVVDATLRLLEGRINKYGLAEVNLTSLGENRFEISVPAEVDAEGIQKVVEALGDLEFRIEVLPSYGEFQSDDGEVRKRTRVWVGAQGPAKADGSERETFDDSFDGFTKFKAREVERFKEFREKGEKYAPLDPRYYVVPRFRGENAAPPSRPDDFAVLEQPAIEEQRMSGQILADVRPGQDRRGSPGVTFDVKLEFQNVFNTWTGENVGLPMAIVLNGQYDSAPIIQSPLRDTVVVSLGGGGGTYLGADGRSRYDDLMERQKNLIATLQSGSLKVTPRFEAKSRVGPTLAGEAVRRGILSTALAFALVLLYMAIFYRLAGMIANVALLLNLVLLVGAMAFLKSTLTLPGIAGVVLTLGMAVDANILIFERIREELKAGRSTAQAVSEGFARAFTTIVDSNVTTFFTAIFLYVFGSGAIQGFAVTLSLGLLASMFTAIYVARTIFETLLRRNPNLKLSFLGEAKVPSIPWMALRSRFIPVSVVLVAASLAYFLVAPARAVYDIDFTGGMKVQARFNQAVPVDAVKAALDAGLQEVRIPKEGAPVGSGEQRVVKVGPYDGAEVVTVRSEGRWVELRHPLTGGSDGQPMSESEQLDAFRAYVEKVLGAKLIPSWVVEKPTAYKSTGADDPWKALDGGLRLKIAIEDPADVVKADVLEKAFERMPYFNPEGEGGKREAQPARTVARTVKVKDAGRPDGGEARIFEIGWKAALASNAATAVENDPGVLTLDLREFLGGAEFRQALLDAGVSRAGADDIVLADPFPVNDLVGPGVATRMRNDALIALLLSFGAIIVYVAFRFRSYAMGFSAVLCLVHDVSIALGAVCLVNSFGLVDARINLGLVAAFLTLVGFSVNDTVVTFDRVRELRGKAPSITSKMLDDAVNQTLARTIRTSLTVFLTLVVLFVVNLGQRSLLEGFAFTMLAGVVVGSYSTIGVAAPLLLFLPWFWNKVRKYRPQTWTLTWPAKQNNALILAGIALATTVAVGIAKGWFMGMFWGLLLVPVLSTLGLWLLWAVGFAVLAAVWGCAAVIPWSRRKDVDAAYNDARAEIAERDREAAAKAAAHVAAVAAARAAAEQAAAKAAREARKQKPADTDDD